MVVSMLSSARRAVGPSALAAVGALLAAAPAHAAYPGPNGNVFFHAERSLYSVAPGGGTPRKLPEDVPGFGGLSISADGTRIVYDDSHALYLMNADGSDQQRLTPPDAPFSDNPSISPDGKRIAYERGYGIWVMNADGTGAHSITPAAAFATADYDPAWSPDGKRIAYTSRQQVWVMNADGSGATSLTPPVRMCPLMTRTMSGSQPDWSPDGTRIAFTGPVTCNNSRGTDIWVMNADGSNQVDLIQDDSTSDLAPTFSPDGTTIAFTRDDGTLRLQTVPAAGGAVTSVAVAAQAVQGPVWGRALVAERVSAKLSATKVRAHGRVVIFGRVSPTAGGTVTVTIIRGKRVVATRKAHLKRARFRVTYRPARTGRYRVVATLPAGPGRLAASSKARTLTVRAH